MSAPDSRQRVANRWLEGLANELALHFKSSKVNAGSAQSEPSLCIAPSAMGRLIFDLFSFWPPAGMQNRCQIGNWQNVELDKPIV
jgi:hypothetical protein